MRTYTVTIRYEAQTEIEVELPEGLTPDEVGELVQEAAWEEVGDALLDYDLDDIYAYELVAGMVQDD